MSVRSMRGRLDKLGVPPADDEPLCIHHGPACALGTQPLPELYVMVVQAKQRLGKEAPPLDEHRVMTAKERKTYKREMAELIAAQKAKNERILAELRAEHEEGRR